MSQSVFTSIPARGRQGTTRALIAATGAGLLGIALAGCQSSAAKTTPVRPAAAGPTDTAAATTYTAERLRTALLTRVPGYGLLNAPIFGEYGSLKPVQDFKQAQDQLKITPAHCADAAKGALASPAISGAPSAIASMMAKGDRSFTEALLAASPSTASYMVGFEVPKGCRTYQAAAGDQVSTNTVLVSEPGRLGQGSRLTGIAVTLGSTRSRTWTISIRAEGYVLTTTLIGPKATRSEAERLSRTAYLRAERSLHHTTPAAPGTPATSATKAVPAPTAS